MKQHERLLYLGLIVSAAAGAASLWLALLEATPAVFTRASMTVRSVDWIAVGAAYLAFSAALGVFSPQIGALIRRLTKKRRVVVTHHHDDDEYVAQLSKELARYGVYTWSDIHDILPGDRVMRVIEDHIKDSDAVIIVTRPDTKNFDGRMARFALEAGIRMIPVTDREVPNLDVIKGIAPILKDAPVAQSARRIAQAVKFGDRRTASKAEATLEKSAEE